MRDSADPCDYDYSGFRLRGQGRAGNGGKGSRRGAFDEEETFLRRERGARRLPSEDEAAGEAGGPPEGERWSTWDRSAPAERGPLPHPGWLVTELAAVDTELGILKTGKEADVCLLRRGVPGTGRSCLLAAKRYRDARHRMFHRDAAYLEGRRVRESRVNRAMASRTGFGREAIAGQWACAEFAALCRLHLLGVPVPYPVQVTGTEVLLEFIGEPGGAGAPRLAETRPDRDGLARLWDQLVAALLTLARHGLAHGDLSPYNLLVHHGRLVLIDLPQVVDVISNPNGPGFLERDARNVAAWFAARGHAAADPGDLASLLMAEAGLR